MTDPQKSGATGFAAVREQVPTLFPYLRRYQKGLLYGVLSVLLTAVAAGFVPLLVGKAMKHIVEESTTLHESLPVFVAETAFAAATGMTPVLPLVWEEQRKWLEPLILEPSRSGTRLPLYFFAIMGLAIFSGFFRFVHRRVLIGISRKIEYDLRNDLFAHLLRMSPSYFDRMTTGDIVARATNDLNQVRSMLGPGLMYPVNALLTMVTALAMMAYISPLLATVALLPPLIMAVGANRFTKILHERFTLVQEQYSKISTKVQENLTGIRVVKAYVREDYETGEIAKLNQDYLKKNLRYFRSMGVLYPFFSFSHNLGRFVVLTGGAYLMMEHPNDFDVADFTAFLLYLAMLQFPMISIGWVLNVIQRGVASLVRINEIFDTQPDISDPDHPVSDRPTEGRIEFRNVSFGYRPDTPVLHSINLEIPAGSILGVVGATGSGKSTLANLVPRLYDPDEGEILLDGNPIAHYRLADLRGAIGFVAQEHYMFSSTIAENIGFGIVEEDYFEDSIESASRLAAFHENVLEFPNGYETIVGERGVTLSGGQKQRTAIARALAIDPKVLILDDALSSVDAVTEEQILTGLDKVMHERTTILISHRISTVQNADWIIVLEDGRIIEQGTHSQLLELDGVYASIHRHQLLEEQIKELTA